MMYGDDPDPYDRSSRGRRAHSHRRRSSPSLIDALDDRYARQRRIERSQTNWPPPSSRYYDDDVYEAPRPTRINFDDDPWLAPGRYGQRTQAQRPRAVAKSPSASRSKRASAPVASRKRQPASYPIDNDSLESEAAAAAATESDALSVFAHIDTESDSGSSGNRENFDDDDQDDDDDHHLHHDQDDDDEDDVESARVPAAKRAAKSRPPKQPQKKPKRKKAAPPKAPDPAAGSGSSFTMGSSEISAEIVARPPPGPEVDLADAGAIAALLWAVDRLDRFGVALAVVLALIVVAALIGAVLAARPTLYVVSAVYGVLWALIHRETRALLVQVRSVHDLHAAMDAVQLAAADVVTVARRTVAATAGKLMRIVQVSAGGSVVFAILVAGLAVWASDWIAVGLVAVIGAVSAAAAALAPVQYSAAIAASDHIIAEAR